MSPQKKITVTQPQFERIEERVNPFVPTSEQSFYDTIYTSTLTQLFEMGFIQWSEEEPLLFLFPGEWYNAIPEGFEVTGFDGQKEKFTKGVSDDDIRYGCLPYGIVTPIN